MADLKIDLTCSQKHYYEHSFPIWEKLPERLKGDVHRIRASVSPPADPSRICMVAGWPDVQSLRGLHRMIYVEHGAGQSYAGTPRSMHWPGYSGGGDGGRRHVGVIGFICPSDAVAARWTTAPSVAVGCPKMDQYLGLEPDRPESICFVWHFDSGVCPEAGSAWPHWKNRLPELVSDLQEAGWHVFGHAHPRWRNQLDDAMTLLDMEVLLTDRDVFQNAAVVAVDNSSLGPEAMLLDRPVIWLNSPQYRRDVHHGGRFWDWTRFGAQADEPDDLLVLLDDFDDGYWRHDQHKIVEQVYKYRDGSSSQRAADWITELVAAI